MNVENSVGEAGKEKKRADIEEEPSTMMGNLVFLSARPHTYRGKLWSWLGADFAKVRLNSKVTMLSETIVN